MVDGKLKKRFLEITVLLMILLLLQILGAFDGINRQIEMFFPSGDFFVGILTETASSTAVAIYLFVFFVHDILEIRKLSRFSINLAVGLAVSMLIVGALKVLFAQPRPGEAQVHWSLLESLKNVDYFAFPSGHTARAAVFAYFLSRRWKKLWPLWWGWALAIATSRLLFHVHWFGDVIFSLVLGPWAGMLVELTESRWLTYYRLIVGKLKLGVLDVEQST